MYRKDFRRRRPHQDAGNALINLHNVNARFEPVGAAPGYVIEAKTGLMNNETGILNLTDGVTYRDDNGLVLVLIDFLYDTSNGTGQTQSWFRRCAARHA